MLHSWKIQVEKEKPNQVPRDLETRLGGAQGVSIDMTPQASAGHKRIKSHAGSLDHTRARRETGQNTQQEWSLRPVVVCAETNQTHGTCQSEVSRIGVANSFRCMYPFLPA